MNDPTSLLLEQEIGRLRRDFRLYRLLLATALVAIAGLIDEKGHERVRLGAPLPDPMIHGVRQKRVGAVSGLLISDANDNERGGYVTSDASGEAFLSLDSEDEQQVLFLANPKGGTNLNLFDQKGNSAQLTVFPAGPRFVMKKAR